MIHTSKEYRRHTYQVYRKNEKQQTRAEKGKYKQTYDQKQPCECNLCLDTLAVQKNEKNYEIGKKKQYIFIIALLI